MTEIIWLFPAISSLFLSWTFSMSFQWLGLLCCLIWFFRVSRLKQRSTILWTVITCFVFLLALMGHRTINKTALDGQQEHFILYPDLTTMKVNGSRIRFEGIIQTKTQQEKVIVAYQVKTEQEKQNWLEHPPLKHLRVQGSLVEPGRQRNFHQFDYQNYLKQQQIFWELKVEEMEVIEHPSLEKPRGARLNEARHQIFSYIDQHFQPKMASYIRMLLFADKRTFSEEVLQSYRSLGILHLFSISGFHITYLVQLIRKLFLRLGITHERTNLMILVALPIYGVLAGLGVGVFRAVVQTLIVLGSRQLKRPIDTINAWAITMMLALVINPYQIFQMSFQMSYLLSALFMLLSKQQWIQKLSPAKSSLLFTTVASVVSIPILSHHFFEIPWITTFANLLFIPFFSIVLFPSLLFLYGSSFVIREFSLFNLLEQLLTYLIELLEGVLVFLSSHFNFSMVTGRLPLMVLIVLSISIFLTIRRIEMKKKPSLLSCVVIGCCLSYHQLSPVGYVLMLDIGQGDSIVIKEPITGKVSMIDTGGQLKWGNDEAWQEPDSIFSIGEDITVPALKSFGISEIDRLYLTHADADHSGEIEQIAKQIPIREIAATRSTFEDAIIYEQIISQESMKRILVEPPEKLALPIEETLALMPTLNETFENNNNQSLVLYVTIGKDKWLFTGDIEEEAERELLQMYPQLDVDYLKVSHHGSQTSTTESFVRQLEPQHAMISAGVNNRFGHPHTEVIERLQVADVSIYRTDEMGAVMVQYTKRPFTNKWHTEIKTVHINR